MLSPRYFIVYAQWLTGPINITSTSVECPHVLDIFSQGNIFLQIEVQFQVLQLDKNNHILTNHTWQLNSQDEQEHDEKSVLYNLLTTQIEFEVTFKRQLQAPSNQSLVCITAVIQSKSEQQHHHRRQLFGSSTSRIPTTGYRVDSYNVYFNGQLVEGLSASSFKDLGYGYAKDIMHVFFMGKQIKGASGSSFQVLAGGWYSKDFMDVYYWGEKLPGASGSSFQVLSGQYAKDFMDVFYAGKKIQGASASSFKILEDGYAKDFMDVYYAGKKVQGASASSFKVLGNGYAKDSWDTYYMGEKVHNG
ncbi:unnamed protein product [Adineta steineri]|uniref:Uncharacterized protein n=1 Tax=Adineta steineri TaxID=433720 RepID=A0A819FKE1_9BILA|nr:unnamed protein product [Adineta steineri]